MAIKSAVSYIFNEEQDGFVAVDFNFINGHDDEIRDWEIIDDFSSIDDKCDDDDDVDFTGSVQSDVSSEYLSDQIDGEDGKLVPEYSPETIVSHRQSTAVDGDVMEYQLGEDDDDDEDSSSSDDLCENGEDLLHLFAGEDLKSVPEYSPETIVSHSQSTAVGGDVMEYQLGEDDDDDEDSSSSDDLCENGEDLLHLFAGEDLKSVPEYSPETIVSHRQSTTVDGDVMEYQLGEDDEDEDSDDLCENGEDLQQLFAGEDLKSVPEIIVGNNQFDDVEAVQEIMTSHRQSDVIYDDVISYGTTTTVYDYDYDYSYDHDHDHDRQEEEEDDYDLDDELVPYSVKIKLGRERIRKLGKRSCSKSVKSKRLTYNYNKAGCFRGKHGLGLKHI